ncbi:MAG TPA: cation-transporting P-type ATPase, partial [Stellaceae bacterium]
VAVGTGPRTEVGHIQRLVSSAETPETPSQRQLRDLGRQLVWLSLSVCGAVFGIGLLRGFGVIQMLRSSISLAVAAVPEGLPMVATTTLALGIEEMRRRDVLIRRLDAIETLAAVQVICFDKTGTLTLNDMAVAAVACADRTFNIRDGGLFDDAGRRIGSASADPRAARLLEIGVLCSDTSIGIDGRGGSELNGTATENAIVRLALDAGIDASSLREARPRLAVRHRSEAYRFMVTVHPLRDDRVAEAAAEAGVLIAVKGSPADVLDRCRRELGPRGERRPLTRAGRQAIERANAGMAGQALRVLGFAYAEADGPDAVAAVTANGNGGAGPEDLTWVGLAGLADPVRPGMRELMSSFHDAGIRTVLVTGDQSATARTVVRQLGLAEDGEIEIVDAAELDAMVPGHLAEAARRAHAFARVSPAQKLQIVRAFQHAGMVVAMTGDGVNDSPALKAADVGVALGRGGTEAAREVADVVLNTDDLTALVVAVERGRTTYTNIRKAIHYLLSTNLSEILVVLAATSAGVGEALSPMQLLWINLISDVLPGIGLACEPPEPDAMERGPRPAADSIVRREDLGALAREAGLIGGGALAACAFGALRYGAGSAEARTMTFGSLVISQLLHALTCRSPAHGLFDAGRPLPPNAVLSGTLAVSFGAQVLALLVPGLRRLLGIVPIGPAGLLVTLAAGVLPYLLNEALKSGDIGRTERIAERRLLAPAPLG